MRNLRLHMFLQRQMEPTQQAKVESLKSSCLLIEGRISVKISLPQT